jgi:hypothetical protein
LGYIPGDPKDKFPYIYAEKDKTRRVVKKIGKGMGFGWSLTFAQGYLWRFDGDFFKMDPETGEIVERYSVDQNEIMNPRGLAWGGEYFWVNDFSLLKIFKFKPKGDTIKLLEELKIDGVSIVWTGEYFWTAFGCEKGICKWTKDGKLVGEIYPPAKDAWSIAWDGKHLWTLQRTCEVWSDPKIYEIEILDNSLE